MGLLAVLEAPLLGGAALVGVGGGVKWQGAADCEGVLVPSARRPALCSSSSLLLKLVPGVL
jgi:hypothetical protein